MAFNIKRNTREVQEIPLASTADIAFLLIVFFLAASALLEFKGVQIPIPKKDVPPMQVLKENLFKIKISSEGAFLHEKTPLNLDDLQVKMREAYQANTQLIVAVRVDENAPSDRVPKLVHRIRQERIARMAIGMDRE